MGMTIGRLVIVGPGAVGSCVAAWLCEAGLDAVVHGRPGAMDRIEAEGIQHYEGKSGARTARRLRPPVLRSLAGLDEDDLLLFCTKNRGLEEAASSAAAASGARPFAISLANGIDNQEILPRHFVRRAYGVVGFNCWLDEEGRAAWQNRGPLLLGTADNSFAAELSSLAKTLSLALPTSTSRRFGDAVHSKI
ncbi:MAG TPA: 2-dehydropantoate 2-reductase, partial [Rectinemataceae bacterium]|nr:2-dehydropantoate 2-reductase [Rectinemataceae bacterium]